MLLLSYRNRGFFRSLILIELISYLLSLELWNPHWETGIRISKGSYDTGFPLLAYLRLEIALGNTLRSLEVILCSVEIIIVVFLSSFFNQIGQNLFGLNSFRELHIIWYSLNHGQVFSR